MSTAPATPPPVKTQGYEVTVDIPVFDRNQGQIAIAKATRQQLFDEYAARVAEARSQVGQILEQLAVVRAQLRAVEDSLPDLGEDEECLRPRRLRAWNADLLASREAQGALAARQLERRDSSASRSSSWASPSRSPPGSASSTVAALPVPDAFTP